MTPYVVVHLVATLAAAHPAASVARPAEPSRFPVSVTATTTAGWLTGDQDRGELFGRLNVSATPGAWRLAARLDTATFVSSPLDDRYTLEKVSVGWTSRALEVGAGDAYVSLGRGLALSLRKVDELGVDTTLRGAKLLVHTGEVGATVALGYANINNVDEATGLSVDDPYDLIGGAQLQGRLGAATLGAYATAVAFHDGLGLVPGDAYQDRALQGGVTVDAPRLGEHVGFYLEGMGQKVTGEEAGFGLYGSATAYLGRATLLFEGKAYGALVPLAPDLPVAAFDAVAYNSPPTVERVEQLLEHPQREIAGGRLRADWRFSPALLAFASQGTFRDWQGYADPAGGAPRPGTILDPYAGVEARWDDARGFAIASAGWRGVILDGSGALVRSDVHVDLDAAQPLRGRLSLTFHGTHLERRKDDALLDQHIREGSLSLGGALRPWISAAFGYDYTTDPTQPRRDYFHGDLAWDLTPSSSLRLLVGSTRGGLRCVSGVCRVFPPFEGARLTATLRF